MNTLVEITALSSKGQIVIPQSVRKELHLETGVKFMVFAEEGGIFLKPVTQPPKSEIDAFFARMQNEAKRVGMTEDDIQFAIDAVRSENK
jgi:AbrB family looped-hinge helix DNA binding protein